jgi:hypothetical protein
MHPQVPDINSFWARMWKIKKPETDRFQIACFGFNRATTVAPSLSDYFAA